VTVHELSLAEARRIAVQAQRLDEPRPTDLVGLVDHLTMLKIDPTAAVAPNVDLVLWSRLGSSYDREELLVALEHGLLVEHRQMIRPGDYVALLRAEMAAWPGAGQLRDWQVSLAGWVEANDVCRRDILHRLEESGPTAARELPDLCEVPWRSTGWTNDKNVVKLLDLMEQRGEVAVAGHRGPDRLWDLAERVYPDDPVVPAEAATRERQERRLASLGIARGKAGDYPGEPAALGEVGEPAVVAGVRGTWRVDASLLGKPFSGRAALLSPLDLLVADRKRLAEIFEFDYLLEMYKPAAQRRWGYFALPVLYGDRLIGKLDATADRKAGVLRVHALHEDEPFTRAMTGAVEAEIDDLAGWLDLDQVWD
jgi:uncharacterized protein